MFLQPAELGSSESYLGGGGPLVSSLARCAVGPLAARTLRVQCSFGHRFLCRLLVPLFSFSLVGSRLSWPFPIVSFNWSLRSTRSFSRSPKDFLYLFSFFFALLHESQYAFFHITFPFYACFSYFSNRLRHENVPREEEKDGRRAVSSALFRTRLT